MADWIIRKDDEVVNVITASEDFATAYAEKHGYTIEQRIIETPEEEPQPTDQERIEALEAENNLLKAQVSALAVNQEFLEDCLIEVGQVVYA